MGSSFKGLDLFGSGAHRFTVGKLGRRVISLAAIANDLSVDGTAEFGDWELRVTVKGRLVSNTQLGLWAQRDAIVAQAGSSVESGVLEDQFGHQWPTMKLIVFEQIGMVSMGRTVSVGYVAEFGRLASG